MPLKKGKNKIIEKDTEYFIDICPEKEKWFIKGDLLNFIMNNNPEKGVLTAFTQKCLYGKQFLARIGPLLDKNGSKIRILLTEIKEEKDAIEERKE